MRQDENHESTHPHEPVARATAINKVVVGSTHREVVPVLWDSTTYGLRNSNAILDCKRANEAPGEDPADHEAPRCVQAREHARAEEGRGELDDPAPRFTVDGTLPAPGVEPPRNVPVRQQIRRIPTK